MDIVVGIIAIAVGLAVCFAGYRLFLFLLPLWGFIVGFWLGSALVDAYGSDTFLATTAGWIAGVIIGIVLALLSYLYWYVSIALLGASVGASLGTGILKAVGVGSAPVLLIVGLVVAIVFAAGVILLNLPKLIVIVYTALAGAVLTIAGVLLMVNRLEPIDLGSGAAVAIVGHSWFWLIVWAVLGAIGLGAQLQSTGAYEPDLRGWRDPHGHGMAPA